MDFKPIWCMYFAGLVSIKSHPRNDKEADLQECAKIADKMIEITIKRMREPPCRGSSEE